MKKFILPLIALIILTSCSNDDDTPQVIEPLVITKADYESNYSPGGETFIIFGVANSDVSIPVAGADQMWDFSTLDELGSRVFGGSDFLVPSNTAFPTATYAEQSTAIYTISGVESNDFEATRFFELNNNGIFGLGDSQNEPASINVASIGAVINYEAQSRVNTGTIRLPSVLFPAQYGDAPITINGVIKTSNFTVDAPAFGLNNTPGQTRVTTDVTQEVIASGIVNLKGIGEKRVLVTKNNISDTTNYFLGGAPAPTALLNTLGATDGFVSTLTTYRFIAEDLGTVGFIDVDESGAIISVRLRKG